jgi:predicted ATP-dependent Lon-type protease
VPDEDHEWAVRLGLEVRRRVKEQQKRIGFAEFRNTQFSYVMGLDGVEKFVATPELPQRFFTHGQNAQGDRHVYASRTRFIPDGLLGLFERTAWPMAAPGSAVRSASEGVRVDVGARMRGMWR